MIAGLLIVYGKVKNVSVLDLNCFVSFPVLPSNCFPDGISHIRYNALCG